MNILVRGARQLLTLRGSAGLRRGAELRELGLIHDGAVLIQNGVIQEAGPSRRVENLHAARGAEGTKPLQRSRLGRISPCLQLWIAVDGADDVDVAVTAHGASSPA